MGGLFGGKVDNSPLERAQQAVAEAQQMANNLQTNLQKDLSAENLAQITPGGEAYDAASTSTTRRRRTQGTTIASQLGMI